MTTAHPAEVIHCVYYAGIPGGLFVACDAIAAVLDCIGNPESLSGANYRHGGLKSRNKISWALLHVSTKQKKTGTWNAAPDKFKFHGVSRRAERCAVIVQQRFHIPVANKGQCEVLDTCDCENTSSDPAVECVLSPRVRLAPNAKPNNICLGSG